VALALACSAGPIAWEDSIASAPEEPHADAPAGRPPASPAQCVASIRVATNAAGVQYAAWWSLRADSSADIMASSSSDGRTWTMPWRLDSVDVGRTGCDRPPPALAADGDNLHVVYSMQAREGPGVFLAHSMDRGRTFHSPVAVVYGRKPGLASIAASGNFVVAAYEDPNTTPTRISIAVSTTMAHLFDFRAVVSPPDAAATKPRVWTDGTRVEVSWVRAETDSATRLTRRGRVR
jgi:hypothetical protein